MPALSFQSAFRGTDYTAIWRLFYRYRTKQNNTGIPTPFQLRQTGLNAGNRSKNLQFIIIEEISGFGSGKGFVHNRTRTIHQTIQ